MKSAFPLNYTAVALGLMLGLKVCAGYSADLIERWQIMSTERVTFGKPFSGSISKALDHVIECKIKTGKECFAKPVKHGRS